VVEFAVVENLKEVGVRLRNTRVFTILQTGHSAVMAELGKIHFLQLTKLHAIYH
jgi:hypothetical protein